MKKIIALTLTLIIAVAFSSCTARKRIVLDISGAQIDEEIFVYYAGSVAGDPEEYGLDADPSDKEIEAVAVELCKKYVVVNSIFSQTGIKLSAAEKVSISQNVNNMWLRFENYYNKIGVSKQTLNKIETQKAYYDAAFSDGYDLGTENEQYENILKEYFYSNYVSFCTVCAYFTSSSGSEMTQLQKNELSSKISSLASDDADAESFSENALQAGFTASSSIVLKKGSEGYPDGFYDNIASQAAGTVAIYSYDECVFAVLKEDLKEKSESVYANYRSVCIKDLYADQFDDLITNTAATLSVEEKRNLSAVINKIR